MNGYDLIMRFFEKRALGDVRRQLIRKAKGHVLEIGVGTGVNLNLYTDDVNHLTLTDHKFHNVLPQRIQAEYPFDIETKVADVQALPFEDETFDTIVVTLVFCTVKDVYLGLKELYRALKPDGKLIFIEHVLPEQKSLRTIFNTITPAWKKVASGCHLNRDYLKALEESLFKYELHRKFFKTTFVSGIAWKL